MKLRDYLQDKGIKFKFFARQANISEGTLQNIMNGHETSISIGIRIEKATDGKVKMHDLAPTKGPKRRKHKTEGKLAIV